MGIDREISLEFHSVARRISTKFSAFLALYSRH